MNKVTCPSCRGGREVMKLGAMIGKCELCGATGKIDADKLPLVKPIPPVESVLEIKHQVAEAIPWSAIKPESIVPVHEVGTVKPTADRTLYKRKTTVGVKHG